MNKTRINSSQYYSRPLLAAGDDESVPQRGVHGEDRPGVSLRHHPQQVVIPPHVHVAVNGSGERQVVLQTHIQNCTHRLIINHVYTSINICFTFQVIE